MAGNSRGRQQRSASAADRDQPIDAVFNAVLLLVVALVFCSVVALMFWRDLYLVISGLRLQFTVHSVLLD